MLFPNKASGSLKDSRSWDDFISKRLTEAYVGFKWTLLNLMGISLQTPKTLVTCFSILFQMSENWGSTCNTENWSFCSYLLKVKRIYLSCVNRIDSICCKITKWQTWQMSNMAINMDTMPRHYNTRGGNFSSCFKSTPTWLKPVKPHKW